MESATETHQGRGPESVETSGVRGTPYYTYVNFVTNGFYILRHV
jgi:hypothetical protein